MVILNFMKKRFFFFIEDFFQLIQKEVIIFGGQSCVITKMKIKQKGTKNINFFE